MNREEAIEELKTRYLTMSQCLDKEELHKANKAIDMAIQALEQEPCEDAISRSDAIRVASGYCHWTNIPDELAKLPSVNPIPCNDAISRQQCIDVVNKIVAQYVPKIYIFTLSLELEKAITYLPSVSTENTGQWIPVSERLPSDDEHVIVSVLDDHGDTSWKYTTVAWLCNGVWISDNDILCGTAIAWMPLPEPYKAESE